MQKLTFTGHETFHCRHFWLKKGYDFYKKHEAPNIEDAILQLGVGKNMVSAIDFWLRAFSIKDENKSLTLLADKIFSDSGYDPYLENYGTLWLLQYYLVKTEVASIYSMVFKDFRKTRIDSQFTAQQLLKYLLREVDKVSSSTVKENTLKNDIKVFLRTYILNIKSKKDLEDDLSSLLIDLSLLHRVESGNLAEGEYYKINVTDRQEIPKEIFLFVILDSFPGEVSVSFDMIKDKVTDAFACSDEGLELKIQEITEHYPFATYKEDAGRKELQFKDSPDKWEILHDYYQA